MAMDPSQFHNQPPFQNPRPRSLWKKHKFNTNMPPSMAMALAPPPPPDGAYSYHPPSLHDLQYQNHIKSRRFYKKKYPNPRFAPYAPRNTTSFLIRAKKSGGIASLISPSPVTPAILPTPKFSPSREGLVDMAKEEWGVDGYGSMSGLIRLRSPKGDEEDEDGSSESSESDVEEHVEVERRLDQDLSRFEMVYPVGTDEPTVSDMPQDEARVARLEEENLTLRERLFIVETEMGEIRRRLEQLERRFGRGNGDDADGSNGVSGKDDNHAEQNANEDNTDAINGGQENVNGEDTMDAVNGDEEIVNGEDSSPVKSAGTPVHY